MSNSVENFIRRKKQMKKFLAEKYNFSTKKPLLSIILDHEIGEENAKTLTNFLEGVRHIDIQVVALADTNVNLFNFEHVVLIPYNRGDRTKLLEAADMALSFTFNDVEEMLLNGTIPISSKRDEVKDYNPNAESGNSFIYKNFDHWSIFATLVRALETYKFPYDWTNIVRQGRDSVKNS